MGFSCKVLQAIVVFIFMTTVCMDEISAQTYIESSDFLGVDSYILINKRQYENVIREFDRALESFRLNYENQVATIETQADLLSKRMDDTYASLYPLDVLNPRTRACVQKYRSNIATVATVKATIAVCSNAATTAYATFVAPAQTTRNNLNNYFLTNFETSISNCNRTYNSNRVPTQYTKCVESTINTANEVKVTNQKTFETQMEQAECSAKARIKMSIDCSYTTQFKTISAIGEYTRLINNCIGGLDTCPPCAAPSTCSTVRITPADASISVAQINNPFRDLNPYADCVILKKSI